MTYREKHPYNVKMVTAFMLANKGKAYKREEVAKATGVSKGAVKGILRKMYQTGNIERHFVKERDGETKTYYNWKRCLHLAADDCVVRDVPCKYGKACCLKCVDAETCDTICNLGLIKHMKPETISAEETTENTAVIEGPVTPA